MKGMSVDDEMLIRIIVGRSGIDLGEIAATFSTKYGNNKTLLQFITSKATKGTYRKILIKMCAIGDHQQFEDEDDVKVIEDNLSINSESIREFVENEQSWDQYISSSPTIKADPTFDANRVAQELFDVLNDKKKKKDAKKILIQTLTRINNQQRQELREVFKSMTSGARDEGTNLVDVVENTLKKGKTMIVVLGLLQRPAEFNCFWIKQAMKAKSIELLIEILCSCSNDEITKMKDFYFE